MEKKVHFTPVVGSGMVVSGETVDNGTQIISGGTAISTTILSSGTQDVFTGTANFTTIDGGLQYVNSGGTAALTVLGNSGRQYLQQDGGTVIGTMINDGGELRLFRGSASEAIVNSGGVLVVQDDCTFTSATVSSGGNLSLGGGTGTATATNVTLEDGYVLFATTSATLKAGNVTILNGTATNVTLNSGAYLGVSAGGSSLMTTINNGGIQHVEGGVAADITVNSGGDLEVVSGGTASGITLNPGYMLVADTSATLNAGSMTIKGGTATNVTLNNGGCFTVLPGGMATATTIGGNESLIGVCAGGTALATTVKAGGLLGMQPGGRIIGLTLSGGGVDLSPGGTGNYVIDSLTVVGNGGVGLENCDTDIGHYLTISSLTGSVDFFLNTDLAKGQTDTITIKNVSNSLTNTLQVNYDPVYDRGGSVTGSGILASALRGSAGFTPAPVRGYTPTISVTKAGATTTATLTKLSPSAGDSVGWRCGNNKIKWPENDRE